MYWLAADNVVPKESMDSITSQLTVLSDDLQQTLPAAVGGPP
jgi:hypothetical protein